MLCERGYIAYLRPQLLRATADSPSKLNWCSLFSVSVSSSLKGGAKRANAQEREEERWEGSDVCHEGRCSGGDDGGGADCQEKVTSAERELEAARVRIAALERQLMALNLKAEMTAPPMQRVSPPSYQRTMATSPRCRRHHRMGATAAVTMDNGQRHVGHVVTHGPRQNVREFETVL